jgi:hypothetical protein
MIDSGIQEEDIVKQEFQSLMQKLKMILGDSNFT